MEWTMVGGTQTMEGSSGTVMKEGGGMCARAECMMEGRECCWEMGCITEGSGTMSDREACEQWGGA